MPVNPRFIPVLQMREAGLVKTRKFAGGIYLGDAINAVSIFNDKMVDEIIVLDIDAPRKIYKPRLGLIRDLASECFMPLCYGGGINTLADIESVLAAGAEKISINTAFADTPHLVTQAAQRFGSQSIVVSIDVHRNSAGQAEVYVAAGQRATGCDPVTYAKHAADSGAGEIVVQSIDRDGTWEGYDIALIESVTRAVNVPVVALGGAGDIQNLASAIVNGGASAAAAGSMFVFFGRLKAVLITVPDEVSRTLALNKAQLAQEFKRTVHPE